MVRHPPWQPLPLRSRHCEDDRKTLRANLMQRPVPWLWILAIALLLLAPGFTARLFVDVLQGVTLLLVFGPLVLAGAGFLAWQWFKRRLVTCPACGTPSLGSSLCPACGTPLSSGQGRGGGPSSEPPASQAVIDVQVSDVSGDN